MLHINQTQTFIRTYLHFT